ncbi:MAG TPA: hypothetical protein VFZ70_08900 [Euzebyales bacterium]
MTRPRETLSRTAPGLRSRRELAEPCDITVHAVAKHLKVHESAGLTKTKHGQRRTVHLEANVFDLMTKWVERYGARLVGSFAL